ncbi:MAG: DUF3050 domain-containing protein [Planctomycetota bacterium]
MTKPFHSARYDQILARIEPLRQQLLTHSLYRRLETLAGLRLFLENHIFAVWDFMSLLKTLQRHLCGLDVPWRPAPDTTATRLINEIVLGEESDEDGAGGYASHFELYRRAMQECGADTSAIDQWLGDLSGGLSISEALQRQALPAGTAHFVQTTFEIIASGSLPRVASAFTLGREDLLPGLFQRVVDELNVSHDGTLNTLQYYLRRHIELDGEQHGPMAARLVAAVCGDDEANWQQAEQAAVESLEARLQLWDNIGALIPGGV